ncbi:hypothetical protein DITRI_Ditri11bG0144200 [Diplodiscus trichospermus]
MAAAASSSSAMSASSVLIPRLPTAAVRTTRCSALPPLPPRVSTASFSSSSVKLLPESRRFSLLQTKASEETSVDAGELFTDLKEKLLKLDCLGFLPMFTSGINLRTSPQLFYMVVGQ